jgi:hypothetical protein
LVDLMNSGYDWSCPYVLRWGYDHRRAMWGAPAAAARVAEADLGGLFSYKPQGGLTLKTHYFVSLENRAGVTDEPAPLSESAEDSVPSSEGTGIALTSDASRSSTNYNLDDKRFY